MPLHYKTGSLFDAPPGGVLVHSCNAQGVWGAGVALEMKERFPGAFMVYKDWCTRRPWPLCRGTVPITPLDGVPRWSGFFLDGVASLIVSNGYGAHRDPVERIHSATVAALTNLFWLKGSCLKEGLRTFHSPRINAGLFHVPWEQTEAVLQKLVEHYNVDWTVWTP